MVHRCRCDHGDCDNAPTNHVFGHVFEVCPYSLLRSPWWLAVQHLEAYSRLQPLADWPHGYGAGTAYALIALRAARADKARREAKTP